MAEVDLSTKSDREIRIMLDNHERKGVTATPLYLQLSEEYAQRTGKGLNTDKSLAHLIAAARDGQFTTYGDLAKASDVPWNKARHAMNGAGGHLDQLLSICHARGLPMLPALCVNQEGVRTGTLAPEALKGFIEGAQRLGYSVTDREGFLREKQSEAFAWGKQQ